jgi:hypothetical protein
VSRVLYRFLSKVKNWFQKFVSLKLFPSFDEENYSDEDGTDLSNSLFCIATTFSFLAS